MSLEINYIDAPEGAQNSMTASGECGNLFADDNLILRGARDVPYATLEPGIWKLDGTMRIMPDAPSVGWWSGERSASAGMARSSGNALGVARLGSLVLGVSDTSGRFSKHPKITLKFPVPYSSTGLTFTFSPSTNQWCSEIRVSWYNGQNLLMEGVYFPDKATWVLNQLVESFDQVQIELLATNQPGHFAKIQRIEVGRTMLFGNGQLVNVRLVNEVDPALCVLSADTMNFEIIDREDRELIPQENQRVELMKDGKLKAVHYIVSSTREARNRYKIVCQSVIGLLEDTFLGGIYDSEPLENVVEEILGPWPFEIDPAFTGEAITGYLPVCTQREALQQLAFAIGAVVSTQGTEKIRLLPVPVATTAVFRQSDIFLGGSVKTSPRVAKVQVYSHSYVASDTEQTLIREEEISGEDVLVTFDSPHHSYSITGGTITDYGVNWVKISADGPVTVTGKEYTHTSIAHTKRNPAAVAKEQSNYIAVSDVTLIHSGNARQALDRLFSVYQFRQVTEQEVVVTNQAAGDFAASVTPWNSQTRGFISSMESTLTQNGHTAKINIQGIEVTLESVWMHSGEVYSGGMEVVY